MKTTSDQKIINKAVNKVFLILCSVGAVALVVVGILCWCGYNFATDMVRTELAAQKIYFPEKGPGLDPETYPDLQKYAGELVDTGPEAKAYANGYIGRHLENVAEGKSYAEISSAAMKDPTNQKLQQQRTSLFQGETLRGILLGTGYAYWTIGMIAYYVSIAAFIGAGILLILALYLLARSKRG